MTSFPSRLQKHAAVLVVLISAKRSHYWHKNSWAPFTQERKQICTQICLQTLWCCMQPMWTLPLTTMCSIICVRMLKVLRVLCVNGALSQQLVCVHQEKLKRILPCCADGRTNGLRNVFQPRKKCHFYTIGSALFVSYILLLLANLLNVFVSTKRGTRILVGPLPFPFPFSGKLCRLLVVLTSDGGGRNDQDDNNNEDHNDSHPKRIQ